MGVLVKSNITPSDYRGEDYVARGETIFDHGKLRIQYFSVSTDSDGLALDTVVTNTAEQQTAGADGTGIMWGNGTAAATYGATALYGSGPIDILRLPPNCLRILMQLSHFNCAMVGAATTLVTFGYRAYQEIHNEVVVESPQGLLSGFETDDTAYYSQVDAAAKEGVTFGSEEHVLKKDFYSRGGIVITANFISSVNTGTIAADTEDFLEGYLIYVQE